MVAALLVTGLAGCGSTGDGDAQPGGEEAPAASAGTPAETLEVSQPDVATDPEEKSPANPGAATDEPEMGDDREALGIDTVHWPEDLDGAQAVFDRMPEELAGMPSERPEFYGTSAGVFYGQGATGVAAYAMGTDADLTDPVSNLAAMFGMSMVCTDGTYAGTAAQSPSGGGPDITRRGASGTDDGMWWFSCDFEATDSEPFTGHAIGWVSGELAWLITAPDEDTTEMTVAALSEALDR